MKTRESTTAMSSQQTTSLRLVGEWPAPVLHRAQASAAMVASAVSPPMATALAIKAEPNVAVAPASSASPDVAPAVDPFDPRWVLAVRTSERLQGALLPPESREALLRLGRVLGLSAFDANMVIAIVQDQARRGHAPLDCPAAGVRQLTLLAVPAGGRVSSPHRRLRVGLAILALLALEVTIILALMWR